MNFLNPTPRHPDFILAGFFCYYQQRMLTSHNVFRSGNYVYCGLMNISVIFDNKMIFFHKHSSLLTTDIHAIQMLIYNIFFKSTYFSIIFIYFAFEIY